MIIIVHSILVELATRYMHSALLQWITLQWISVSELINCFWPKALHPERADIFCTRLRSIADIWQTVNSRGKIHRSMSMPGGGYQRDKCEQWETRSKHTFFDFLLLCVRPLCRDSSRFGIASVAQTNKWCVAAKKGSLWLASHTSCLTGCVSFMKTARGLSVLKM